MGEKELRIGCMLPLTGSLSKLAETCRKGYLIALQQHRRIGGSKSLSNRKVIFEFVDCSDDPQTAMSKCEQLIDDGNVVSIVGCYGSPLTMAVAQVTEKCKFPFIAANATADELTERGFRFVFRARATDSMMIDAAMDFGVNVLRVETLAFVYARSTWAQEVATLVRRKAEQAGIDLMFVRDYDMDSGNIADIVHKMNFFKPSLVIGASSIDDAILVCHLISENSWKPRGFLGLGGGYATYEFPIKARDAAEHFSSVVSWSCDVKTPGSAEFVEMYTREHRETPLEHAASAFQTSQVLFDALGRSKSTEPEDIAKALRETNMMTICGLVKIDSLSGQNTLAQCIIVQIQNGQFATVWPSDVASRELIIPL